MLLTLCLLFIGLRVSEGCRLKDNRQDITASKGWSVLLPCSCTDLNTKPQRLNWMKLKNVTFEDILFESDQYRKRFQLVNDHSPGNLSLLISHLTEEDGGYYRCEDEGNDYTDIRLTVKVCTLENPKHSRTITAHTGGFVLLPCSCTDLQTKPENFTWKKHNTTKNIFEEISINSDQYRNRVQLVNDHSPGNLSLLISHLTEEDRGEYRCEVIGRGETDIKLTVKGGPTQPTTTTPVTMSILTPSMSPQSLPFVPFALVTVILLHIIVAVVYYTSRTKAKSDSDRVQYSPADGDGVVNLE